MGCDVAVLCPMRGRWDPVNAAIREALGAITLADMQHTARPVRPASRADPPQPLSRDRVSTCQP